MQDKKPAKKIQDAV